MHRYQDYVIKDGQFVGKFEEMYQRFDDPWHQASAEYNANSYSRNAAILNIRRLKIPSVVEFGCGLGYYTNHIRQSTASKIVGVDISPTAISKARKLWPEIEFSVERIQEIEKFKAYEAILMAEVTWYILDDLEAVLDNMLTHFAGKILLHTWFSTKDIRSTAASSSPT